MGQGTTNLSSFLEQLQELGIYGGEGGLAQNVGQLSQISGEDIGTHLAGQMGYTGDIQPGLFTSLSENLVKGAQIGSYSPQIQATQGNLLSKLTQGMQGPQVKKAYGGFAGSGARDVYGKRLQSEYGQGMTKGLTGIYGQQTQAQAGLGSWMQQQLDTMRQLQGDQA